MARSISDINDAIIAQKEATPALDGLTSTSKFAIWRLWAYITAVCTWTLEVLFDNHVAEVKSIIAAEKKGRAQWYAAMAELFQYGDSLVTDQDYYDNTGIDPDVVAAKKIVSYAAGIDIGTEVRIKVARIVSGDLAPLTTPQLTAFEAYMQEVKYAGVMLKFINSVADDLKLSLRIYYNPLVLDPTGKRLDGTNDTPVQDVVNTYLISGIAFNSYFITSALVDQLQQIDGVVVPSVISAQARYGLLPFADIVDMYQPDAGYMRIASGDLSLTFIPSPI